jgi:hypothetical protein
VKQPHIITCPKCEITSYLPADVDNRYCGRCGYHDSLHNTTPGIPGVSAKFRQPTPVMQLQAELASMEGNYYCFSENLMPRERFDLLMERHFENIRELHPHLDNGAWIKPTDLDPPAGGGSL